MDNSDKRVMKNYLSEVVISRLKCHLEKMEKIIKNCEELIDIARSITEDERHLYEGLIKTRDRLNEELKQSHTTELE